jgi:hypothetical protein
VGQRGVLLEEEKDSKKFSSFVDLILETDDFILHKDLSMTQLMDGSE